MSDDPLNWLAMQYVLDELDEQALGAFESRLENDLAACEAVANASRFRLSIQQAMTVSTTESPLQLEMVGNIRRSWSVVVAAVACLFLGVIFWPRDAIGPGRNPSGIVDISNGEDVQLVSLWRTGMTGTDSETNDIEDENQEFATDEVVPAWLLAGVTLEANRFVEGQIQEGKDY